MAAAKREAAQVGAIVGGTVLVAAIGGAASAPAVDSAWYRRLDKPPWQPPGAVFGPVWTVLYGLLAGSMIAAWRRSDERRRPRLAIILGSNLALNLAWTLIFFRGRNPLAAGVEIIALEATCLALIAEVRPVSRTASLALVPYALWVAFATALTWSIAARNR